MAIKRITTNLIKDSDIATVDIANNAITAAKITDGNITTAKLADLSVTAGKLAGTLDLTGKTITVATATTGDSDTSPASTAFVQQEIAALVDSSPSSLNTLNELAAALGDDANFSTTVTNSIATKLPLAGGTLTGNLNFGDSDKAIFGAGSDLQIYHDGSNSYIKEVGTGSLVIDGTNITIRDETTGKTAIDVLNNTNAPLVMLRYDNSPKLTTTSTGIDVTGTATMDGLTVDGEIFGNNGTYGTKLTYSNGNQSGIIDTFGNHNLEFRANNDRAMNIASNGDISFYEDTGTTAKLFWDASTESLGIGTTSPNLHGWAKAVTLDTATNAGYELGQSGTKYGAFALQGDGRVQITNFTSNPLTFQTNNAERMRIDSSGNVGIGTSSPSQALDVVGAIKVSDGILNAGAGGSATVFNEDGTTADFRVESTSNTHMLFVDGGLNRVGIGTSSPAGALHLRDTIPHLYIQSDDGQSSKLLFGDATDNSRGGFEYTSSDAMIFMTNNLSEKMRIDSSGNVLVGTTSETNWETVAGFRTRQSGSTTITRSAAPVLYANRLSSDGAIQEFRKDGTSVGSIGTLSGLLGIGNGDAGLLMAGSVDAVAPYNASTNATRDAAINLGTATNRFKDLYLSGGVVFDAVAGNATSNTLDDYEEGTWTPACGATLSTAVGTYTKIGNQVTVHYHVVTTGGLPTSTAQVQISGLPFTSASNMVGAAPIYARYYTPNDSILTSIILDSESKIRLINTNDQNFDYTWWGELEASANNSVYIIGTATYQV